VVKIPEQITYVEAYLTMRCNLGCSYCINAHSGVARTRKELSAKEWIDVLNRLDFGHLHLTFGGGEPTLHKEFFDILRGLRSDIKVDLLTNLTFDVLNFAINTTPERFGNNEMEAYRSIRVSYHPDYMDAEQLVHKIQILQDLNYKIGIFGINHPLNVSANMHMAELARKHSVYFFVKDFLGDYQGNLFGYFKYPDAIAKQQKKCYCRTRELLIAPDGQLYKCHRDLYHNEFPIANITDEDLKIEYKFRHCDQFGFCNPCDIKLKTNRFLQMGSCSVDIEMIKETVE